MPPRLIMAGEPVFRVRRRHIPDARNPVLGTGDELPAVAAEHRDGDFCRVGLAHTENLRTRRDVQNLNTAIQRSSDQHGAIRAERCDMVPLCIDGETLPLNFTARSEIPYTGIQLVTAGRLAEPFATIDSLCVNLKNARAVRAEDG